MSSHAGSSSHLLRLTQQFCFHSYHSEGVRGIAKCCVKTNINCSHRIHSSSDTQDRPNSLDQFCTNLSSPLFYTVFIMLDPISRSGGVLQKKQKRLNNQRYKTLSFLSVHYFVFILIRRNKHTKFCRIIPFIIPSAGLKMAANYVFYS